MKVVVAIDSFKGSMSSIEAGEAAAEGIRRVYPDAEIQVCPLADGGEGTVEALTIGKGGNLEEIQVTGPLGEEIPCIYGILPDRKTAVLEMASAAGLAMVPEELRDPMYTTTYGVGEIIADAIKKGCRRFLVGIGGSATNDGGIGMLQALGYDMLDYDGVPVVYGAEGLKQLHRIEVGRVLPELKECEFHIACDVKNPLCGVNGCSAVFGPQKGATPEMVRAMDAWMWSYVRLVAGIRPDVDPEYPGVGAAGGLGFAFRTFLRGRLEPGVQIVLRETGLEELIRDADMVVTGEGRLDGQTVMGKAPVGVAELARKYDKPVIALAGCLGDGVERCMECGIDAYFPILRRIVSGEEAMRPENAVRNMADTAEQVFRLLALKN